jgi:hypothetical protein
MRESSRGSGGFCGECELRVRRNGAMRLLPAPSKRRVTVVLPRVRFSGTGINDNKDRDRGWTVELGIPWHSLEPLAMPDRRALPPLDGDEWRMDFRGSTSTRRPRQRRIPVAGRGARMACGTRTSRSCLPGCASRPSPWAASRVPGDVSPRHSYECTVELIQSAKRETVDRAATRSRCELGAWLTPSSMSRD